MARSTILIPALLAALTALGAAQDERARVADLEDRRDLGDGDLAALAASDDPAVRAAAVRALGRIQDPAAVPVLLGRLADAEPAVQAEVVFALGQIDSPDVVEPLSALLTADDPTLRALAAEALGKRRATGRRLALEDRLSDEVADVRQRAALALGFLGDRAAIGALAERLLEEPEADLEWRLVYAIGRLGGDNAVDFLIQAAGSEVEESRVFAALFLGRIGTEATAPTLRELVADRSWMAAAAAARALAKQPGPATVETLVEALGHGVSHVRREAATALGSLGPDVAREAAGPLFGIARRDPSPMVRSAALAAALSLDSETARIELDRLLALTETDAATLQILEGAAGAIAARMAAGAEGAGDRAVALFRRGPDRVRAALLGGLAGGSLVDDDVYHLLLRGLASVDLAVRGTAAEALSERPDLRSVGHLAAAYDDSLGREGHYEIREYLVAGLAAIDSPIVVPALEKALRDPVAAVRTAAADGLEERTGVRPAVDAQAPAYRPPPVESFDLSGGPRVEVATDRGRLVIELHPADAPVHVASFLTLVERGHYDGLPFHRVVSAFVVQGGDPRGDGWGDAGYTIRDEINRRPYRRGTLGMPKAGKDTGGCQLFVTHLPTPHLDGRYTVFGQVVEGLDVLDRIEVGDRIVRARRLER